MSDLDNRASVRAELVRRVFILALIVFCVGVVVGLFMLVWAVRSTQLEGTPTGQRLLESSDRIIDCTTPEGECFKRSQERTGDAIATLNLGALYAVFCVDRNPEAKVEEIQACVRDLYDRNGE